MTPHPDLRSGARVYLGDSIYMELSSGMVKLTTHNSHADDPRNELYLEMGVLDSMLAYLGLTVTEKEDS